VEALRNPGRTRIQSFFRAAVLISYEQRCAVTGIALPELLVASHIIPWSVSVDQRADPKNGLCLSALIDRAFDRGLLTFDEGHCVVLSKRLRDGMKSAEFACSLLEIEGKKLRLPKRFPPADESLDYHRTRVFVG
jgi:putative restriction endonuclease